MIRRVNLRSLLDLFRGRRLWRNAYYCRAIWTCFWGAGDLFSTCIIVSLSHHAKEYCETSHLGSLELWSILLSLRYFISIPILIQIIKSPSWYSAKCRWYRGLLIWFNILSGLWFLWGQVNFFYRHTCMHTAPMLWTFSLINSITVYLYFVIGIALIFLFSFFNHVQRMRSRDTGLSIDLLNDIPCRQWDSSALNLTEIESIEDPRNSIRDAPIFGNTCSICMDDFEDGDVVRDLKCGHSYHRGCVDEWLMRKNTCPLCRKKPVEY